MCKYCEKKINNKRISNVDNDGFGVMEIVKGKYGANLLVRLAGLQEFGYKPADYFAIKFCPICGRKLGDVNEK